MQYILIAKEKERIAIASNAVRSIRKTDFTDSNRYRIFLERDTGDFNRFVVDNFEVREMSGLELTEWLKGEEVRDVDSDEDLEWQQYKQALETIYRGAPIGVLVPRHVRDWLEYELSIISAGT